MHLPPPPDARELLPPLLACLPTSFVSPRPPPAFLPLLSPLLRQRLTYLSSDAPSRSDGWLALLSWDTERAAKLPAVVERMHLEPHPVSGEVELDEVPPAKYRRVDEETLHARLEVEQFELLPIYLWCETDEHGGTGPGWRLAELRSLEDLDDGDDWFDTISKATDDASARAQASGPSNGALQPTIAQNRDTRDNDSDDGDYWAAYDRTPGRTPAQKRSPAPQGQAAVQPADLQRTQTEQDYYARYGTEVQPAMDSHDPDEEHEEIGPSTLNGTSTGNNNNTLLHPSHSRTQTARPDSRPNQLSLYPSDPGPQQQQQQQHQEVPRLDPNVSAPRPISPTDSRPNQLSLYPSDPGPQQQQQRQQNQEVPRLDPNVSAPRPISPTSSHGSIERLESKAEEMSNSEADDHRAQMAIKQHISTDIKSLFRLARSSGMERTDFERIVKTELECLSMFDEED